MPSFFDQFFGSKPKVPTLPTLNLGTEQQKSIAANQAALPGAEALVGKSNQFSIDQINKMLEQAIPGYSNIAKTISSNIASEVSGQIPSDVQQQLQDSTAAQALAGGYGGSGAHGNLVARDLGLTSLNLTQQGLSSMESWTKTAASIYEPSMISVGSMFITPQQQASFDVSQNEAQFQRQWMQNQISAMPAPWSADLHQTVAEVLSAYGGGGTQGNPYMSAGGAGGGGFGGIDFSGSGGWGGQSGNTGMGGAAEGTLIAG